MVKKIKESDINAWDLDICLKHANKLKKFFNRKYENMKKANTNLALKGKETTKDEKEKFKNFESYATFFKHLCENIKAINYSSKAKKAKESKIYEENLVCIKDNIEASKNTIYTLQCLEDISGDIKDKLENFISSLDRLNLYCNRELSDYKTDKLFHYSDEFQAHDNFTEFQYTNANEKMVINDITENNALCATEVLDIKETTQKTKGYNFQILTQEEVAEVEEYNLKQYEVLYELEEEDTKGSNSKILSKQEVRGHNFTKYKKPCLEQKKNLHEIIYNKQHKLESYNELSEKASNYIKSNVNTFDANSNWNDISGDIEDWYS